VNRERYIAQVTLLLDCLPALREQRKFALKGGTAINFFIRDFPRLSVDIDLTYIDTDTRHLAIKAIEEGLYTLGQAIAARNKRYQIATLKTREGKLKKIIVSDGQVKVKIEPNFILRGTLLPVVSMDINKLVESRFAYSIKDIPVLAREELYAGKICAALDRQHPRDFFDVKELLENQGISEATRHAFVVYLVCSPRPIHELLKPNLIVLKHIYENEFINMTEMSVSLDSLIDAREKLIKTINLGLTNHEKDFILSVKQGHPDYSLMEFDHLHEFPALNWKVMNIKKMDKNKHRKMINKLELVLNS